MNKIIVTTIIGFHAIGCAAKPDAVEVSFVDAGTDVALQINDVNLNADEQNVCLEPSTNCTAYQSDGLVCKNTCNVCVCENNEWICTAKACSLE